MYNIMCQNSYPVEASLIVDVEGKRFDIESFVHKCFTFMYFVTLHYPIINKS